MRKAELIASLESRERRYWDMIQTFLDNNDPHGVMDATIELQTIRHTLQEVRRLDD